MLQDTTLTRLLYEPDVFQDQVFERLKRHVAPGGRLYLVGMQPLPDHPGEMKRKKKKIRMVLPYSWACGLVRLDGWLLVYHRSDRSRFR